MKWEFSDDRPIYSQIVEKMKLFIVSGELSPGERVMPVRELAYAAGVNPNTMQRALSELERMGLMSSNRTSGRFVTEDVGIIQSAKLEIARKTITDFLSNMHKIGFDKDAVLKMIEKHLENR